MSAAADEIFEWVDKRGLVLAHEESLAQFGGLRGMRDEGLLESALARPQNILAYRNDATLSELAAAYAVGSARNHPFIDGNQRAAFLALGIFLDSHGYLLETEQVDAFQAMLAVASGDMNEDDLAVWISDRLGKVEI